MERRSDDRPSVVVFNTNNSRYVYDIHSNLFFRASDTFLDVLESYKSLAKKELFPRLRAKYSIMDISCSYNLITSLIHNYQCFYNGGTTRFSQLGLDKPMFRRELANIKQLIIEITQKCNFRCRYCVYSGNYSGFRKHGNSSMTYDIAKRAIDYYCSVTTSGLRTEKSSSLAFGFYGGEPLIEFNLIRKCVDYIRSILSKTSYTPSFLLTTNGSLLNDEMIHFLIDQKIAINISLDGPEGVHNINRIQLNGEGSFQTVWKNIERIREADRGYFSDYVGFLAMFSYEYDLIGLLAFFENKEFFSDKNLRVNWQRKSQGPSENKYTNYDQHISTFYREYVRALAENRILDVPLYIRSLFRDNFIHFQRHYIKLPNEAMRPTGACIPGCAKLFVDAFGELHTCEKINTSFSIGNVNTGVMYEKVHKMCNEYAKSVTSDCERCECIHFCNVCFANAAKTNRFDSKAECQSTKKSFKTILMDYFSILEGNPDAFLNKDDGTLIV